MTSSDNAIDLDRVTEWFRGNIEGAVPPLSFSLITGGHSNLTFRVEDARGQAYVLRRPPLYRASFPAKNGAPTPGPGQPHTPIAPPAPRHRSRAMF